MTKSYDIVFIGVILFILWRLQKRAETEVDTNFHGDISIDSPTNEKFLWLADAYNKQNSPELWDVVYNSLTAEEKGIFDGD